MLEFFFSKEGNAYFQNFRLCRNQFTCLPNYVNNNNFFLVFYFQAGKDSKPHFIDPRASLVHKILIPIVILIAAGAAAPLFLITSDVAGSCYTCTNPISVTNLTKHNPDLNDEKFVYDLYSTLVTVFTYALPVLILPLSICIGKYLREGIKKK